MIMGMVDWMDGKLSVKLIALIIIKINSNNKNNNINKPNAFYPINEINSNALHDESVLVASDL